MNRLLVLLMCLPLMGARLFDDAVPSYLTVSSAAISGSPTTFSCLVNSDDATIDQTLFAVSIAASDNNFFSLRLKGVTVGDPVYATSRVGITLSAASTTGYSANIWHVVTAVFRTTGDIRSAYIDGGSRGNLITAGAPSGMDNTSIGINDKTTNSDPMSGSIAECAVWDINLSDEEITSLGKLFSPLLVRPQNLVGYWRLTGNESPEIDTIGGRNMTLVNSPTKSEHPRIFMVD